MNTQRQNESERTTAHLVCTVCKTLCHCFECPACGNTETFMNVPRSLDWEIVPKRPNDGRRYDNG